MIDNYACIANVLIQTVPVMDNCASTYNRGIAVMYNYAYPDNLTPAGDSCEG